MPAPEEMSRDELIMLLVQRDARIAAQNVQITALSTQVGELLEANETFEAREGGHARQIAELTATNDDLAARLAKLEHLLSRNSANSSMPPSKDDDPGKTPPPAKPKRGADSKRKRGKQPGAPGANLAWVDKPDDQVDRFPQGRCECGHDLAEATDLGVVDRYQQHEIPQMSVTVTQYDQHQVRCGCERIHTAARPEGARGGVVGYGPNLQSFAVYMMVVHFVPAQRCVELLESLTGAAPSVGFVHGMLARASGLLAEVDKRIRALITLAYAVCADETPLRVGPPVVVHDRYHLYDNAEIGPLTHQLCTQHLLRDLDGAGETYPDADWPTQIADALRGLIHQANLARQAGRDTIEAQVRDKLINEFTDGVKVGLSDTTSHGSKPGERKARLLLEVLRDRQDDVLRFAHDLRVPPTSNQAERDLRPAKIQQKISGRLTSEKRTADRYRIRGYLSTAAKHGRNTMDALRDTFLGRPWIPPDPAPA